MGVECDPDPDGSMDAEANEHEDNDGEGERWFLSERAPLSSLDFFAGRLSKDSWIKLNLRFFSVLPSCCSSLSITPFSHNKNLFTFFKANQLVDACGRLMGIFNDLT